ncbi:MAG: transposase [Vicinamibacterales bacterium]|nr:transposase [Vicinamibacterales bacterium]
MASTKSSRVNPNYKKRYRVGNWPAYERGLRARGDVTVWFAEEALNTWTPPPTRRPGCQQRYSDPAILTALTLRMLFRAGQGPVLGGHGVIVGDFDAGSVPSSNHATTPRRDLTSDDFRRESVSAVAGRLAHHTPTLPPWALT